MDAPVYEVLQAATTISKTLPVLIGKVIPCGGYDYVTLFVTYVKGDETGLILTPSLMATATGTAHQQTVWSADATATRTAKAYTLTASANTYITIDVTGVPYIMFTQGGSNNDGTPTGTLAASYTMK